MPKISYPRCVSRPAATLSPSSPPSPHNSSTSTDLRQSKPVIGDFFVVVAGSIVYIYLESRSNEDQVANIDLDALARALPYILDYKCT